MCASAYPTRPNSALNPTPLRAAGYRNVGQANGDSLRSDNSLRPIRTTLTVPPSRRKQTDGASETTRGNVRSDDV
jgi:hypothetical protein